MVYTFHAAAIIAYNNNYDDVIEIVSLIYSWFVFTDVIVVWKHCGETVETRENDDYYENDFCNETTSRGTMWWNSVLAANVKNMCTSLDWYGTELIERIYIYGVCQKNGKYCNSFYRSCKMCNRVSIVEN